MGSAKQRTVLAALLIHANAVVSSDRLSDILWGDDPPPSASGSLQAHVSRLRGVLASEDDERDGTSRLVSRPPGYVLRLETGELDAAAFEERVVDARSGASHDPAGSVTLVEEALRQWRGPAYAEFADMDFARAEAARLEELRLAAFEDRCEACLSLGRHAEVVGDLEAWVAEHPLRERLWRQLMLALYRSGRQAEALRAYQEVRRHLSENLGIAPSPVLRRLEQDILGHDAALDWAPLARNGTALTAVGAGEPELPVGEVTFLLTDIERSTELWESGSDAMSLALARHEALVVDSVRANQGTPIKTRGEGDSTFSVFGSARDALDAALALQRALTSEPWPERIPIATRVALQTGEAELREGDYYGPIVNRAARLRAAARGGQIVMSQATADAVRHVLPAGASLVSMGTHHFRGLARREPVYGITHPDFSADYPPLERARAPNILSVGVAAASFEYGGFVGRVGELDILRGYWQRAVDECRRLFVLANGEPGIGKTSLVAEFGRWAQAAGALVLYGRCDRDFLLPYQPFAMALRDYAAGRSWSELRAELGTHASWLGRLIPELDSVHRAADSAPIDLETERYRLFEAITVLLSQGGGQAPVMLILDDLHWADKSTVLLLQHLARDPNPASVLLVGTCRPADVAPDHPLAEALSRMQTDGVVQRMDVGGLEADEVATLLRAHAPDELLARTLADSDTVRLVTGGNPFFIKQVIYHLAEHATEGQEPEDLRSVAPEGVRDLVAQRLARLSPEALEALSVAAVIGPEFDLELLVAGCAANKELVVDGVEEVLNARLIEDVPGPVERYAFSHAVVRSVIYRGLPATRRMRLHRRVGEALDDAPALETTGRLMELAHHFLEAAPTGVGERAVAYAISAGKAALASLAFEDAASLSRQGLEIVDEREAAGKPFSADVKCDLLLQLGQAELRAGRPAARDALHAAFAIAHALQDAGRMADAVLTLSRGFFARMGRTDRQLVTELETAIEAQPPGDGSVLADLLATHASELVWAKDGDRRFELSDRALAMARRLGDARTTARVLLLRNMTIMAPDTLDERTSECEELMRLADDLGDPGIRFQAAFQWGGTAPEAGDVQSANEMVELAEAMASELRQPSLLWQASVMRTARRIFEGDLDEADRSAVATLDLGRRASQDPEALIFFTEQMLEIRRWQGRLDEMLPEFRDLAGVDGFDFGYSLARYLYDAGEHEAAARCYESVLDRLALPPRRDPLATTMLSNVAYLAARLGDADRASRISAALAPSRRAFATTTVAKPVGAHYLGMLAGVTEEFGLSEDYFKEATDAHRAVQAPLFLAETQVEWARVLSRRGGDHARAERLLEAARAAAIAHDALFLARACDELSTPRTRGATRGRKGMR
ncbi:MAG: BTAD domain-containing putative transcriptional regulator [Acidimicrobiia bacterium]